MLFIGSDHAGFELKSQILGALRAQKKTIEDCGTDSDQSCDYPVIAKKLTDKILKNSGALGILICGSGVGMSIAANKVKGIRAACVSEPRSAALCRQHNNAHVLCLGARIVSFETAMECVNAFLSAQFESSHPRHQRRIDQMTEMEGKS
jgi:ribose 5-phosphate isomerase B